MRTRALGGGPEADDSILIVVEYLEGSTASTSYLVSASPELSKERLEVHAGGKIAICDNFRVTTLPGGKKVKGVNHDNGQAAALAAFVDAARRGGTMPMTLAEIESTIRITFDVSGADRA